MDKRARVVLVCTATILLAALVWAWKNRAPEAIPVSMALVQRQDIYNSITAPGTVETVQSAAAAPAVNAVVTAVYAQVGDVVSKGETLCTLQPSDGRSVDSAALSGLWQAAMQSSGGEVCISENRSAVTAPCTGTVLSLPETGQKVYQALPCAVVANLSRLRVRVRIPELYAGEVETGQRANISAAAVEGVTYAAQVESVSPVAVQAITLTGDAGTATVEASLPLRGQVDGLRPGYRVTAKIFTDFRPDALVIPYEAIRQQGEQEIVYVVRAGRVEIRPIQTGYMLENVCEVTSGLSEGENIVLDPPDELSTGDVVTEAAS